MKTESQVERHTCLEDYTGTNNEFLYSDFFIVAFVQADPRAAGVSV